MGFYLANCGWVLSCLSSYLTVILLLLLMCLLSLFVLSPTSTMSGLPCTPFVSCNMCIMISGQVLWKRCSIGLVRCSGHSQHSQCSWHGVHMITDTDPLPGMHLNDAHLSFLEPCLKHSQELLSGFAAENSKSIQIIQIILYL